MGLLSWISGRQKIALTDGAFWAAWFGGDNVAGKTVTPQSAMQLAAFWACVRLISETVATLPLGMFRRGPNGEKIAAPEHPLYGLLHDSPNADLTSVEYWEGVVVSLCTYGNAYSEKSMSRDRLSALLPLPTETVAVRRDDSGALRYRFTDRGKSEELPEEKIFHVRGFGTAGDVGLSPVSYARQSLGIAMATDEATGRTFADGMRARGFFTFDQVLGHEQREQVRKALVERYMGPDSPAIGVLEAGMKFQAVNLTPEDAEMILSRRFNVEEVCRWLRVPPILIGHAADGQTMWGCLTGGTHVFTEAGPRPIRDVKVGQRVWTHIDGEMALRRVVRSGQTGVRPVLTVRTRDRSIRATANHEFLVRRKFSAPRPGCGGYRAVEWRNVWVRADELTTDDYLLLAHDLPSEGTEHAPNGRALTESFMEFCGLYVAEGSMNTRAVVVARADDAPYMGSYREAMRLSFDNRGGGEVTVREQVRSTAFSSVRAVREMVELGFAGTARTKRVPGWVFGLTKPLVLAFLRGYLDGDGTVNERGWITWTSVSRDLIDDVRHLCMLAGVPVGEARGYPITWGFGGRPRKEPGTVWQAWCFSVRHNRLIGSHDPRYVERLAMAPEAARVGRFDPGFVGRGAGGARPGMGFDVRGASLSRVASVSGASALAVPVFDIEVEGGHSFIANGVLVHNSGVEQIMIGWLTLGLRTYLARIEKAIAKRLLPADERRTHFAEFNVEGLLRGDSAARSAFYSQMAQNGVYTRNEIRARENLPPAEGGDVLTVQSNLLPLDQLGAAAGGDQRARAALRHWLGIEEPAEQTGTKT